VEEREGGGKNRCGDQKKKDGVGRGYGSTREKKNRGEEGMDFPKDLYVISELLGLVCKAKFPIDLKPELRNAQNESWRVFKLYNIALGPKFKNSKLIFLHVNL
jgi:hypothetical protein